MSQNNIQDYKEDINEINKRLNNLVEQVDTKKNFFNNVFFAEKDQNIPMNLYNIHYNSSQKDFNFTDVEASLKQFNFDQPDKIFLLPSSDESGNETKNNYIPSFSQVCNDIVDLEYLEVLEDEKSLPKGICPIFLFRGKEPLTSINKVLNFVKAYLQKDPYEIKVLPIYSSNENKNTLSISIKFYTYADAKSFKDCLSKTYNITGRLAYDKRELIDSKWYCVIFRMEGGGDQKLGKFVKLMEEIFKAINDDNKKFLSNSIEGTCEAVIEGNECIKKLGEIFYCAIRVDNFEQALMLCVNYNKSHELKVNLHNLTYKMKKSEMPQILIDKEGIGEKKKNKRKLQKSYKEDDIYLNEAVLMLFPSKKMLSKKHRRNKIKQGK